MVQQRGPSVASSGDPRARIDNNRARLPARPLAGSAHCNKARWLTPHIDKGHSDNAAAKVLPLSTSTVDLKYSWFTYPIISAPSTEAILYLLRRGGPPLSQNSGIGLESLTTIEERPRRTRHPGETQNPPVPPSALGWFVH